jgi:hypothetical protein
MAQVDNQGDQIVRISAHWTIVYFGQVFENTEVAPKNWLVKFINFNFLLGWATSWAIFSQNHLVTLLRQSKVEILCMLHICNTQLSMPQSIVCILAMMAGHSIASMGQVDKNTC